MIDLVDERRGLEFSNMNQSASPAKGSRLLAGTAG
jgi:hypothetical protein